MNSAALYCVVCQWEADETKEKCPKDYWKRKINGFKDARDMGHEREASPNPDVDRILKSMSVSNYDYMIGCYEGNLELCIRIAADE